MTIKVFISPIANDGILRVIEAQVKYLPKFGVEVTHNIHEADIVVNHGTDLHERIGVPSVHVSHGLYWSRQKWGDDFMDVNRMVVESMRHAVAHTVPSEWVGTAVRRGGYFYPEVVYHGISAENFQPLKEHGNYVAWAKARADFVSDPNDVMRVAPYLPSREFQSTIGYASSNLKIVGVLPHKKLKEFISGAGVYLSTARETFGIATLEALAYGIPVVGFDWGGNSEIIIQGQTGYLAPPGDFKALAECIELCFAERDRLSRNAVEDARTRWKWEPRIEQYANIFKRVYEKHYNPNSPKVSVVVTAYKLDAFLPKCLDEIQAQTMQDFECLVVDDASLPSTREIVSKYSDKDNRFRYHETPKNLGLVGARNYGLSITRGKYIRHVDADDFLAKNALELESVALDRNRGIDIAYGHIEQVRTDGSQIIQNGAPVRSGWPEEKFHWNYQMAHMNQLPSCVMARREVYERSGGYRTRMHRNEDAEFWCRVTSLGFRAEKITQAVTYYHRERHDSKGAMEWKTEGAEPDWTAWFPWRWGGHDYNSGMEAIRKHGDRPKNTHLVPFGAQGPTPQGLRFWYVHDHAYPVVSIIVTCGPSHKQYLIDALDSIQAQTYPDWECIVVNDTGEKWDLDIMGAPWAKVVNMGGNKGASAARNEGYKNAKGKYIVWLDADDYWLPWFLEKMVNYAEHNKGVIYSDIIIDDNGKFSINKYRPEFQSELVVSDYQYSGSSVLIPREIVDAVMKLQGGWDEKIEGKEDWDWAIAVHHLGFCAYHIQEPLFVYRTHTTTKRVKDHAKMDEITSYIDRKWAVYRTGEKQIMCGCQNPKTPPTPMPSSLLSSSGNFDQQSIVTVTDPASRQQMVMMEYLGKEQKYTINSRAARISYQFGDNEHRRIRPVFFDDVAFLLSQNKAGVPEFRQLTSVAVPDAHDPAAFLGKPITV